MHFLTAALTMFRLYQSLLEFINIPELHLVDILLYDSQNL